MEELYEFIYEAPQLEGKRGIRTIRDAQNFNMKKSLELFFDEPNVIDNLAEEAKKLPDYDTMNTDLIACVYYIWSLMPTQTLPKEILNAAERKEIKKKNGREKIYVAPKVEVQKAVFHKDTLTNENKTDIIRYMKYIIQINS